MNQVPGIEKHPELLQLVMECEELLDDGKYTPASVDLRRITEYFIQEYLKANPGCVGENLQANITNLYNAGIISQKESGLFHKLRKFGNRAAHLNDDKVAEDSAREYLSMVLAFLPEFLKQFPQPSPAPVPEFNKQQQKHTYYYYPIDYLNEIDYSKITPLPIDVPDYRPILKINGGTQYLPKFFVNVEGKMYVDRVAMTQYFEAEARKFLADPPDRLLIPEEEKVLYVPGIIQEYIGFGSIRAVYQDENSLDMEWDAGPIDGAAVLRDYAFFCREVVLPDCVTSIDHFDPDNYLFAKGRVFPIVLPGTFDGSFEWLRGIYDRVTLVYEPSPDCDAARVGDAVYSRDFSWLRVIFPGAKYSRLELDPRVRRIYSWALNELDAEELVIPEGIEELRKNTICNSTIKRLVLPASIKNIRTGAVCDCPNLETVEIPCGVRTVENSAFRSCPRLVRIPCKTILTNQNPLVENPGYEGPDDMEEYINWLKYMPIGKNVTHGYVQYLLPRWVTAGSQRFNMEAIEWIKLVEERKNIPQDRRTVSITPGYEGPDDIEEYINWIKYTPLKTHVVNGWREYILPEWVLAGSGKFKMGEIEWIKLVEERKNIPQDRRTFSIAPIPVAPPKPAQPEKSKPERKPDLLDLYIRLGFVGKLLYVLLSIWLIPQIVQLVIPIAERLPSPVGLLFALAVLLALVILAFFVYFLLGTHVDARKELYKKEKKK